MPSPAITSPMTRPSSWVILISNGMCLPSLLYSSTLSRSVRFNEDPVRTNTPSSIDHTTIDYICVSDINRVLLYNQVHWPSITQHDVFFATFNFEVQHVDPRVITCRSLNNVNRAHFRHDLEDIN